MDKILSYKDLLVWQKSMDLVAEIYRLTLELPEAERWGLVSQMRRAAVSIPSKIAEGYGRQTTGEYRHHRSISRGSLLELETQLLLCEQLGFLEKRSIQSVEAEIQQISKMMRTLINKLR
jgi:four helix bundle protein